MSKYRIRLDGKTYEMEIERADGVDAAPRKAAPVPARAQEEKPAPAATSAPKCDGACAVLSPMPGTIVKVNVAIGDAVAKGQTVLLLEAMKMENEVTAPRDGRIVALHVAQGDAVQGGTALLEIGE